MGTEVDFARMQSLIASNPGPLQGAIGGNRFCGVLPDLSFQPLINLQANGLLTGQICRLGSSSKGANSGLAKILNDMHAGFIQSLQNTGIQPAPIQEARIETPNFGNGGGFAGMVGRGSGWSQDV